MSVFWEALTIWVNGGRSLVALCTFLHLGMITVFINLIFIGLIFLQSCSKLNVTQYIQWVVVQFNCTCSKATALMVADAFKAHNLCK